MFREFFSYSKKEQYGVFVLLLLIVLGLLFILFYPKLKSNEDFDYSEFNKEIEFFLSKSQEIEDTSKIINQSKPIEKLNLFKFNPNSLSRKGWESLGFSSKQIDVIFNYLNKGGKFYDKEDLKKVYSISDKDYNRIEDYIIIEKDIDTIKTRKSIRPVKEEISNIKIDLNKANVKELVEIKGIGKVFANRIVKYRNFLGGFYNVNQLKEVYGFNPEVYNSVKDYLYVNNEVVDKLEVNKLSTSELSKHPYISYELAKKIVDTRKVLGSYTNINEIKNHNFVPDSIVIRLNSYLKFN